MLNLRLYKYSLLKYWCRLLNTLVIQRHEHNLLGYQRSERPASSFFFPQYDAILPFRHRKRATFLETKILDQQSVARGNLSLPANAQGPALGPWLFDFPLCHNTPNLPGFYQCVIVHPLQRKEVLVLTPSSPLFPYPVCLC